MFFFFFWNVCAPFSHFDSRSSWTEEDAGDSSKTGTIEMYAPGPGSQETSLSGSDEENKSTPPSSSYSAQTVYAMVVPQTMMANEGHYLSHHPMDYHDSLPPHLHLMPPAHHHHPITPPTSLFIWECLGLMDHIAINRTHSRLCWAQWFSLERSSNIREIQHRVAIRMNSPELQDWIIRTSLDGAGSVASGSSSESIHHKEVLGVTRWWYWHFFFFLTLCWYN